LEHLLMKDASITRPDDPRLGELASELAALAAELDRTEAWPEEQLRLCGHYGVHRWFLPQQYGGFGWREGELAQGYLRLSAACLTTTFILTQRSGAMRRIADSGNEELMAELLPDLLTGDTFTTLGISHLTTSRRHLATPILTAAASGDDYVLNGYSAWVTGAAHADTVVLGATTSDGQQLLVALPTELPGVSADPPAKLIGLSASHTGALRLDQVVVPRRYVLAGPAENVMAKAAGAKTGGLQTSTLAIGLSSAAVNYLFEQAQKRPELHETASHLADSVSQLQQQLLSLAEGADNCSADQLRADANSLVLRSTGAALAAAKGAGYVVGHPAGRWCREGLFFLIWSCPQPVLAANLCELAGIPE
jgi:alkylation response protein AidB-like acyl-CoA dehydrogenase